MVSESPTSARSIARIAAVLGFCFGLVHNLVNVSAPSLVVLFGLLATVIGIVDTAAKLTYARQLALRVPDQKLARNARIVMWGLLVILCLSTLIILAMASVGPLTAISKVTALGGTSAMAGLGLGCVIGPASLFFGLWAIRLIDQFRKALRTSARLARETWTRNLQ